MKDRIVSLVTLCALLASSLASLMAPAQEARAANSDWFYVSPDVDGDGLPNTVEESGWCNTLGCFQTDPLDADSDNDGLTDGEEKLFESNPNSDTSPGIYALYQDEFQTKEYYPWQPYGHRLIARGDSFTPTRPDDIDRQKGHPDDLDAVVVRRGATFYVGGPLGATLSIAKSVSSLTTLTPVKDPYSGWWKITIPTNARVGQYTLTLSTLSGKSLDLFVIFELPTPTSGLTQQQINTFLYDNDPSVEIDETTMVLADRQYPTTESLPGYPPYNSQLGGNNFIAEGWSYKFFNHQYNRYILEDYAMPAMNGQTNQQNAAVKLAAQVDALTVFRNPRPLNNSWDVIHPGSNLRQECSNIAALLTTFSRASGLPSTTIIADWRNSSFDHATEIWVNNEWRVYHGCRTYEMKPEPNNTLRGAVPPFGPPVVRKPTKPGIGGDNSGTNHGIPAVVARLTCWLEPEMIGLMMVGSIPTLPPGGKAGL